MQLVLEHFSKSSGVSLVWGSNSERLEENQSVFGRPVLKSAKASDGARPVADGTMRAPAPGFSEHCSKNRALTCLEARQERGASLLGTLPHSDDTPALVYL
jgi:hypothetical protein